MCRGFQCFSFYTNLADTLSALVERITDMEGEELQTFLGVLTDSKSSDLNPSFTDWRTEKDIITESVLPQVGVNAKDGAAVPGEVEEEFQEEEEAEVVMSKSRKLRSAPAAAVSRTVSAPSVNPLQCRTA